MDILSAAFILICIAGLALAYWTAKNLIFLLACTGILLFASVIVYTSGLQIQTGLNEISESELITINGSSFLNTTKNISYVYEEIEIGNIEIAEPFSIVAFCLGIFGILMVVSKLSNPGGR